jgi:hypothetical protein
MNTNFNTPDDDFAQKQLQRLIGKHLLVAITHTDYKDEALAKEQIHGTIEAADYNDGIVLVLSGSDKKRTLPLNAKTLQMAKFSEYEIVSTGEKVEDVDFTMRLTMRKAQ